MSNATGDTLPWPWSSDETLPWQIAAAEGGEVPIPVLPGHSRAALAKSEQPVQPLIAGHERVFEVTSAVFLHAGDGQPDVYLAAVGVTRTLGWSDAILMPWIYIQPPPDGIYDFDLVAKPPGGLQLPALGSVIATQPLIDRPDIFRGARVHPGGVEVKF